MNNQKQEKLDELEKLFAESFISREVSAENQTAIYNITTKSNTLKNFLKTIPRDSVMLDVGAWRGEFGHFLMQNNDLLKNSMLIELDRGDYGNQVWLNYYEATELSALFEEINKKKEIFNENTGYVSIAFKCKNYKNVVFILGTLGDFTNLEKLFSKEFLEKEGFSVVFLRRMFRYVNCNDVIEKLAQYTGAFCIIDYNPKFDFIEYYRAKYNNYKLDETIKCSIEFFKKTAPTPKALFECLNAYGFRKIQSCEKKTYYYCFARK